MYYVYFGLIGWDHEGVGIYPVDLPSDWRLSFYNTQFRCVYISFEVLEQTSVEEIEIWLRDTSENFRFILEVPESNPDKLSRMGDQFGGRALLSTEAEIKWIESEPDFRELASIIRTAVKESRPIILIMRKVNLTLMRQINELIDVLGV